MPILKDYRQFDGRHWETGSVQNYLAYCGFTAPHTKKPFTEALLLGASGGIVMGYFSFAYKGYDPHVAILTRSTFDPLNTMLSRLGIVQDVRQTTNPQKAADKLIDTLQDGRPAIVWAELWSLPYNGLRLDKGMWANFPLVVYGSEQGTVHIADRAAVPLTVTTDEFNAARGRVKKDKFRLLTLDEPDPDKLPQAVQLGIRDTLKRYVESPVKNAKHNFGFAAFDRWTAVLSKASDKQSWAKVFPPGGPMYAGLASAFENMGLGVSRQGDRALFADFLDEASVILDRSALKDAAKAFRKCAKGWDALAIALLPDEIAPFRETRELILRRRDLFVTQGNASLSERKKISERLAAIRRSMEEDFPLDDAGAQAFRERLASQICALRDQEHSAYSALNEAS
jgi:hypothetical protein